MVLLWEVWEYCGVAMRSLGILWYCYEKSGNIVVLLWEVWEYCGVAMRSLGILWCCFEKSENIVL